MKTILYNTQTQEQKGHSNNGGCYRVGGKTVATHPEILPAPWIELEVTRAVQPVFDAEIEKLERKEVVDLENKEYRTEWDIVPLSEQELRNKLWEYPEYDKRLDVHENVLFTPTGSAYYAYLQLQGYPIKKDGSTIKVWLDEIAPAHQPFIDQLKSQNLLTENARPW